MILVYFYYLRKTIQNPLNEAESIQRAKGKVA